MEMLLKRPWVFLLQFSKLILITAMLITLKDNNYEIRTAVTEMKEALSHLLVKDFNPDRPNRRIYSFQELNLTSLFATQEYMCLSDTAISLLGYPNGLKPDRPPKVQIEIQHLTSVNISNNWEINDLDGTVINYNHSIGCERCNITCVQQESAKIAMKVKSLEMGILRYTMYFDLQALLIGYLTQPHCVHLVYELFFVNTLETGMETGMWLHYDFAECETKQNSSPTTSYYTYIAIDVGVMLICLISFIVVIRKLVRAYGLYTKTRKFIEKSYHRHLNRREKNLFVSYWHICIIMADIVLIGAGFLKFLVDIEERYYFDSCSLLLGIGVWLSYLGLLRYLVFDKHYSMLLNTMVAALPHLARFLVCVIIISLAFILCGWLILSPYCTKFATFWVTMETLFSLLNGDDMFATFSLVKTNPGILSQQLIGIFSRLYLYSYVCFFIYVVLSLCISIVEDAYTVVSNYKSDSCPWIQDASVLPEFATCWEVNLRQRRGSARSRGKSNASIKSKPRV